MHILLNTEMLTKIITISEICILTVYVCAEPLFHVYSLLNSSHSLPQRSSFILLFFEEILRKQCVTWSYAPGDPESVQKSGLLFLPWSYSCGPMVLANMMLPELKQIGNL